MDAIEAIIKTGLTVLALCAVMGAIAALFMFIFSIATGIDDKMQG